MGILLNLGCGEKPMPRFVNIDKRNINGVDIVHDLEVFPWPIEDNSCLTVVASHIYEHIKPWLAIEFMDEIWRITKPNGQLAIAVPYATSAGYYQDPTHCNPCNEATWQYFDPGFPLYNVYKPKPWKIDLGFPVYHVDGNMEVLMIKVLNGESDK
jgi:hypothetical protein